MDIRVGSIVKPLELEKVALYDGSFEYYNPCTRYNAEYSDIPHNLQVCVGIVLDDLNSDVVVNWVQVCQYHHKTIEEYQVRIDRDFLLVVGQL